MDAPAHDSPRTCGGFVTFYARIPTLSQFLPVPIDALTAEFAFGVTPEEICARTLRTLMRVGARHFYISNLPLSRAPATLSRILALV